MADKEFTPAQIGAIKRGIILGRTLQKDHPEIAELYREGNTLPEIVYKINVQSQYGVSYNVAWSGVKNSITGHRELLGIDSFEGLIPNEEERKLIAYNHKLESGIKLYLEGKGVHRRTKKKMSEDGRKAGSISGRKQYEKGIGMFGRTKEQLREVGFKSYKEGKGIFGRTEEQKIQDRKKGGNKGGQKSALARGQTLVSEEEKEYAYQLSLIPEFQHPETSRNSGFPNYILISSRINNKFHNNNNVRSTNSVRMIIKKYKKSLENKVGQ